MNDPKKAANRYRLSLCASRFDRRPHSAFTLVELLIVVVIIGMLAAISLAALQKAQEAARIAKTKSTITKLNDIIMRKFESYKTRRVTLFNTSDGSPFTGIQPAPKTQPYPSTVVAAMKLCGLRDLIRMELPDRWTDVAPAKPSSPLYLKFSVSQSANFSAINVHVQTPALSARYYNNYVAAVNRTNVNTVSKNAAAKCLYMIVMSSGDAAGQFTQDEIADLDGDGLPAFVDGWKNPIRFIRWPAGFITPLPNATNLPSGFSTAQLNADSDLQSGDAKRDPDPFDPNEALISEGGYAIYPLIYSAGSDGVFDINVGGAAGGATFQYNVKQENIVVPSENAAGTRRTNSNVNAQILNPYAPDTNGFLVGQPLTSNQKTTRSLLRHFDNIHNHRIDR